MVREQTTLQKLGVFNMLPPQKHQMRYFAMKYWHVVGFRRFVWFLGELSAGDLEDGPGQMLRSARQAGYKAEELRGHFSMHFFKKEWEKH